MWPNTEEYYRSIQTASYKAFEPKDKLTKQYIDLSVGFYGGCSYHPGGWEKTFKTLRENFPTAPLVLIEDGQPKGYDYEPMAARYNATFLRKKESIYLYWPTMEQCWEYLQWIKEVAAITKTEWLVQLHPDNIFNDRFHIQPPGPLCGVGAGSRSGRSGNPLFPAAKKFMDSYRPTLEQNGYGWCGGGCIHVPTYLKIMEDFTIEKLKYIFTEVDSNIVRHEDCFLPFLFNLYGFPFRVWLEIEEPLRGEAGLGNSAAIQHGVKTYYNLTPQEIADFERKIIEEVRNEKVLKVKP
jgi:hypothetical protein